MNTPQERRQRNLNEDLRGFPYVNGALFAEHLQFAAFDRPMRQALLEAANFDWSRISPAIFGALFQEVVAGSDPDHDIRRNLGAHYTSERDILKVVHPLFLDALRAEFDSIQKDRSGRRGNRLEQFRVRLTQLKFFDPACGCGNFLVIAYRELRALELDVLRAQHSTQQAFTLDEVSRLSQVDVNQFYGIEIEEWPVRIAEVALWLTDHQANLRILEAFSQPFVRLPLRNSPHIHHGNALQMNWNTLLPSAECSYILGNPPFVGHHYQSASQKEDQQLVMRDIGARGVLDYVCNWYVKAAEYIQGRTCPVAFVSTNSISQGEQPGILWTHLFARYGLKIHFAYQTFAWESEARGAAHVHVVIIGFVAHDRDDKVIFSEAPDGTIATSRVTNISPYLIQGPDKALLVKNNPPPGIPKMSWGNKPTDGGHLILSPEERDELIRACPPARHFIRQYMSGGDFIDGVVRYCLWLPNARPEDLAAMPEVMLRVAAVRDFRLQSTAPSTRDYARFATRFRQIAQPASDYLAIPEVSSESRAYIPIAIVSHEVICSNTVQFIPGYNLFHFGVLTSSMHMAWLRVVAGRLESRFRYSNTLVYNNYPWPQSPTPQQRARIEECAQGVLDARARYPESTLARLYDPLTMPVELVRAHQQLDRAVERSYRPEPFTSDRERVEYLFALYEQLSTPLLPRQPNRRRRRPEA